MTARSTERRFRRVSRRLPGLQPCHRPGRADRRQEEPRRHQHHRRRAEGLHQHTRQPGPEDGAERAAHGDGAVQALALLRREPIGHERPEDHRAEEIEDAEPDVEHATADLAHRRRCHGR